MVQLGRLTNNQPGTRGVVHAEKEREIVGTYIAKVKTRERMEKTVGERE